MHGSQPWLTTTRMIRLYSCAVAGSCQYVAGCPTSVMVQSNKMMPAITQRALLITVSVFTVRQALGAPNDPRALAPGH